jgi:hypothetical protein
MARKQEQANIPNEQDVNVGFDDDMSLSPEEAQARIATMLARSESLETLSETTEEEVRLMSALGTIAQKFNISMLDMYLTKYLQLKVSLHRQGRKEISEIAKPSGHPEQQARQSLKSMLLGR